MKVSVVGVGRVGKAVSFALIIKGLPDQLVLVGRTAQSCIGDAADLRHASCFSHPAIVTSGSIEDTRDSDVVILAASAKEDGGDRRSMARANGKLFETLVAPLVKVSPYSVYIVVTNPVDGLTQLVQDLSGLPYGQVIGSGALLDTLRFRALLAERCDVHPNDLRAYILGEHGESQVAAISAASVGGAPLGLEYEEVRKIARDAKDAGTKVFQEKGYTDYGVALATASIVEAIIKDRREVLPVSIRLEHYCGESDVCLSVPAVIGRRGVVRRCRFG